MLRDTVRPIARGVRASSTITTSALHYIFTAQHTSILYFFSAVPSSSQVVGYNTVDAPDRGQQIMVGANFVNVSGAESLDIQSITLVGDNENATSMIKWWDPTTKKYSSPAVYVAALCDPETDDDLDYGGWGDEADWYPIEKTFAPGEGFWFIPGKNGVGMTTAGQVLTEATEYVGREGPVRGQQIMVLNMLPTALDIQSIKLYGDNENATSMIKWWNSSTKKYSAPAVYVSALCDPVTDDDLDYGGWGDEADWYPIEKSFDSGAGFWFIPGKDNVTIQFPNPFYASSK